MALFIVLEGNMSAGHCTVGGALNVERFISVLPAAGVVVGAV